MLCLLIFQESHTYVAGEWNTFNAAIKTMESFYGTHSPAPSPSCSSKNQSPLTYPASRPPHASDLPDD